jgi:putative addiction module component (TIGR02574 family)
MLVEALELPTEDRAALAEELLASLHAPDPNVEQAWAKLIERRAKEVLEDGVTGPECEPFLLDLVERLKRGQ